VTSDYLASQNTSSSGKCRQKLANGSGSTQVLSVTVTGKSMSGSRSATLTKILTKTPTERLTTTTHRVQFFTYLLVFDIANGKECITNAVLKLRIIF
jgi:hypothetical protein